MSDNKRILIASEIPAPHIENFHDAVDYDFIIASMWQEFSSYRDVYNRLRHDYVILDNGAFELGKAMDFAPYHDIINEINPNVVVLPDMRHDFTTTMRLSMDFLKESRINRDHFGLMGVLQGESVPEYERLLSFYKYEDISLIGIPYGKIDRVSFIRNHPEVDFHVLGLPYVSELVSLRLLPNIASLDTSLPVKFAAKNLKMSSALDTLTIDERPEYNKHLSGRQFNILASNLEFISHLCDRTRNIKIKGW